MLGWLLAYFDSPSGIHPIVDKHTYRGVKKWLAMSSRHKFTTLPFLLSQYSLYSSDQLAKLAMTMRSSLGQKKHQLQNVMHQCSFLTLRLKLVHTKQWLCSNKSGDGSKQGFVCYQTFFKFISRVPSQVNRRTNWSIKQNNVCYKCTEVEHVMHSSVVILKNVAEINTPSHFKDIFCLLTFTFNWKTKAYQHSPAE